VAVGDRFKDLLGDELAERRLPLRVTGGTKAALLTREREQVLVPAIGASDTGEAMGQNPAALEALQGAGDEWYISFAFRLWRPRFKAAFSSHSSLAIDCGLELGIAFVTVQARTSCKVNE
jgi:hypothetical protein